MRSYQYIFQIFCIFGFEEYYRKIAVDFFENRNIRYDRLRSQIERFKRRKSESLIKRRLHEKLCGSDLTEQLIIAKPSRKDNVVRLQVLLLHSNKKTFFFPDDLQPIHSLGKHMKSIDQRLQSFMRLYIPDINNTVANTCCSTNFAEAGSKSKGASALGVALGLGEIKDEDVTDEAICSNWNLYSNVASTSAGNEQVACKVIVIGNSTKSVSKYRIGSGVMKDTLDVDGAKAAFKAAGLKFDEVIPQSERERIATVFINAGADAMGSIRGRRTTMKSDYLSGYQGIFAKAVINAIVGSMIGDTMILASAGYEHQGPLGANLVAAIVEA